MVTKADDSEFPAYVPSLKAFSFEKAALRGSEASKRSFPVFLQIVQLLLPPEPQTVGSGASKWSLRLVSCWQPNNLNRCVVSFIVLPCSRRLPCLVLIPFIVSHIVDESISSLVGKRLWEQLEKAERLLRLKGGPALFGDLAIVLRTALFAGTPFFWGGGRGGWLLHGASSYFGLTLNSWVERLGMLASIKFMCGAFLHFSCSCVTCLWRLRGFTASRLPGCLSAHGSRVSCFWGLSAARDIEGLVSLWLWGPHGLSSHVRSKFCSRVNSRFDAKSSSCPGTRRRQQSRVWGLE